VKKWPAVVYIALFAFAAAFRFLALKNGFVNDHFVYISGGRQMLFGEWPTRDWIDPGLPLMFGASALAQAIFGSTLFAEAVLVSIAFGLAAAFTVAAVRQLTGSMALAILAALFEIAVFPRSYSYPKIVAYAFEFWLYGRYLARPGGGRLCAMAAGVAVAFLFRHDHGLFLGAGAVLTIHLARDSAAWKTSVREAATFAVVLAILLLPYVIYVQAYGGLWLYFRTGIEFSQREALRQWHVWPLVFGDERPLESALVYELYLLPLLAIALVIAARFTDYQLPTPAVRRLMPFFGYVDRCTSPDDRLLIGGFMVEVPFYSRRLFAAGQEYFGSYFGSDANERFAFDRLQRQRVPFVIIPSDDQEEFDSRFSLVAGFVHTRYAPLTDVRIDDEQTIHILVNRDIPAEAPDAETGWPCFTSQAKEIQSHRPS